MTLDRVKQTRRAEAEKAAGILGAEVRFFDAGDYPLKPTDDLTRELVEEWAQRDPLQRLERHLVGAGVLTAAEVEAMRKDFKERIDALVDEALAAPEPTATAGSPRRQMN